MKPLFLNLLLPITLLVIAHLGLVALLRGEYWAMLLSQIVWLAVFMWVVVKGVASLSRINDQASEAQQVAAQKRFIAHAAHQLRTPLTALRLESELMLNNKALPAEVYDQAQRIKLSTERMIRLGQQLLVLARADSTSNPKNRFIRLDLCEWARTSGAEWLNQTKTHGVVLNLIAPESPAWVDADPLLLDELLGNLIDNALRYAQVQQGITIRITANPPTLCIEDDGVGISMNDQGHAFDAFYRGANGQNDGSGLGLAIVREIAMAHGAGWNLLSRPHVDGTWVSVVFPGPRMGTGLQRRVPASGLVSLT